MSRIPYSEIEIRIQHAVARLKERTKKNIYLWQPVDLRREFKVFAQDGMAINPSTINPLRSEIT